MRTFAALVLVAVSALTLSTCKVFGVGLTCGRDIDCAPGDRCLASTCVRGLGGEGDGAEGEGDGGEGEGNAAEGEGEGNSGEGEGEGEGNGAEGEGEGQGPPGDEDGDGVLNAHDACPGVFDPGQADGDGDGVGDACDPRPNDAGDALVYFDGFDGALDPAWTILGAGSWSVGGGVLLQADAVEGEGNLIIPKSLFTVASDDVVVETRASLLDQPVGTTANINVTVRAINAAGLLDGYTCTTRGDDTFGELRAATRVDDNLGVQFALIALPGPVRGAPHVLLAGIVAFDMGCVDDAVTLAKGTDGAATYATGDGVALGWLRGRTAFEYVAVYALGGPLPP